MRIHHFTATLSPRDAVGAHTLALDDLLREMGHETAMFAQSVHPDLRGRAADFRNHDAAPSPDLLLYQASTGSPVADHLLSRPEPLVLNYHNLTPAEFFDPWEPHVGAELDAGRRQLARLARRARAAVADSHYNASELEALGMERVWVAPVLFDPPPLPAERVTADPPTLLFVGRLAPNKTQHDLIATTALLRARRPGARLVLVGTPSSDRYAGALRDLAADVCPDGVDFAGSVDQATLIDWYGRADAFLCLSEHEGFCVPVIEAMAAGLPVIAFDAAAVPETIGAGGLVLDDKRPASVVAAIERVLDDAELRARLVHAGKARAGDFAPEAARARHRAAFTAVFEEVA
ncbi:MAG: glycosyltransferase family 4 protein [Actinomycetota bacterium]